MHEKFDLRLFATLPLRILLAFLIGFCSHAWAQSPMPSPFHDPELAENEQLQGARAALSWFPADLEKRPDWVDVLRRGLISPRETLRGTPRPAEAMGEAPKDGIVFNNTREMPHVVFPHQPHTAWLACANCHDGLYERKKTGRGPGMEAIFTGRHCGTCHGRVAFAPEGSCYRCHSLAHAGSTVQALGAPNAAASPAAQVESVPVEDGGPPRRRRGMSGILAPARPQ